MITCSRCLRFLPLYPTLKGQKRTRGESLSDCKKKASMGPDSRDKWGPDVPFYTCMAYQYLLPGYGGGYCVCTTRSRRFGADGQRGYLTGNHDVVCNDGFDFPVGDLCGRQSLIAP